LAKGDIAHMYKNPHLGGRGDRKGSAMVPFERAMLVSYRLSFVITALSLTIRPQFAGECLQRSRKKGMGHFWAKFGEERLCRCKPNFNAIRERHGSIVSKSNRVHIFSRLSTMHERDRQTNKPRNGNMCRNRRNRLSAMWHKIGVVNTAAPR